MKELAPWIDIYDVFYHETLLRKNKYKILATFPVPILKLDSPTKIRSNFPIYMGITRARRTDG